MMQIGLVGVGAGLAAALLFLSPLGGTLLALPLFLLSSLPIAIAGLAWGSVSSAIAAVGATGTVAVALSLPAGVIYLALFGVPMAWACHLAGLSRTDPATGTTEWYPPGRILLQGAAATAAGLIVVGLVTDTSSDELTSALAAFLADMFADPPSGAAPPTAAELEDVARTLAALTPFLMGALYVIILVVNLWLASRIAEASGRLARPRERLWTTVLPNEALVVFAIAIGAAFFPGSVGYAAGAVAGAFGGALALIGLAVLHAVTIGNSLRVMILVAAYVLLVFFGGFPLVILAVLGVADTVLHLRARRLGAAPPPST